MIKESDIPPIKGNRRIGHETATDASVVWGGAKLPEPEQKPKPKSRARSTGKRPARAARRRQQSFTINKGEALKLLVEKLGVSAAAVVNLGIAVLEKQYL